MSFLRQEINLKLISIYYYNYYYYTQIQKQKKVIYYYADGLHSLFWGGRVVRWCWVNFQCRGVLQFR